MAQQPVCVAGAAEGDAARIGIFETAKETRAETSGFQCASLVEGLLFWRSRGRQKGASLQACTIYTVVEGTRVCLPFSQSI